jgi:CheY-like chemotaxis protein
VTLDLLLQDMSGWDVLRAIRAGERNRDVAAIVVTVVAEKGAGMGFVIHDFLIKPVTADALLGALQNIGALQAGQRSLLIVDDDPNAARLLAPVLRDHGFQITVVRDGASGLKAANTNLPSAVVLDLLMPGMDGFEFLRRFRLTDTGRHTPVIVWTVKDLTNAERVRLQASAQASISKGAGSSEALIAELAIHLGLPKEGSHGG